MQTQDCEILTEGMKIFYRWSTQDRFEYTYTGEHGMWNLEWTNEHGRICRKQGKPKYMFSTKKALLEAYPELYKRLMK